MPKASETKHKQSRFPYKAIFETSIDGILLATLSGTIFDANPAACAILGRRHEEFMSTQLDQVLDGTDPRTREAFVDLYNKGEFHGELLFLKHSTHVGEAATVTKPTLVTQALAALVTTGKLPEEIDLLRANRPSFPAEVSCTVHIMPDESLTVSIIFRDATEHKQMLEALRELAIRDELTGLYNRREMMNLLQEGVRQAALHDQPISLAMGDIDHFKDINDTYGHQVGDEVLKKVGQLMRTKLRAADLLARYGGEEFSIVMPATPSTEALQIVEGVRRAVAEDPFRIDAHSIHGMHGRQGKGSLPIRLTISMGLATFPEDAISEQGLISAADKALYKAKRLGRNRVMAYGTKSLIEETGEIDEIDETGKR